ncbi:MAG TPA: hypothetical protein VK745_20545 [Polyangiaceae bacterium]|nr:hypothetical protein [Polyangiaceae bacterium]
MSTPERSLALPADLLSRLSRAFDTADPEVSVRRELARCLIPEATAERVVEQAVRLAERARQLTPRASSCEVELSLGVLLVLCGVLVPRGAEVAS